MGSWLIQTKAVRFVPDSYDQDYYVVQLNVSYQKYDHSSEKYRAELSWCKNFNFAVLWYKKSYQQIFWISDTEKKNRNSRSW